MAIQKQEFYEGAALHSLLRSGRLVSVAFEAPFFLVNDRLCVMFKYSTKNRSPWGFTFTPGEQRVLERAPSRLRTVLALICGSDGVAAVSYDMYCTIAPPSESSIHIACYRKHGEHYQVNGPHGALPRKVAPSSWQRILDDEDANG